MCYLISISPSFASLIHWASHNGKSKTCSSTMTLLASYLCFPSGRCRHTFQRTEKHLKPSKCPRAKNACTYHFGRPYPLQDGEKKMETKVSSITHECQWDLDSRVPDGLLLSRTTEPCSLLCKLVFKLPQYINSSTT